MFKIATERLVKQWPAMVKLPLEGGDIQEIPIKLDLLLIDTERFNLLSRQGDPALVKTVVKGWHGIADTDGELLVFSDETLELCAKNQFFVSAVLRAYLQASSGQAATKNS
ncbi:hypothetical protein NMS01_001546 [Vibrio cholerae]|uniref:hypothetical protein n=1 Tax=Vibrio cholerae TaxID=666 RepID=UPI001D9109B3|nr:hypothetical protein [Vibrio cholerae]EGR2081508.1 hypothetical protein [Vibrio cholerae]EGR3968127.1 hypothetical protein [Vibrio cholerae]EJI2329196.1 hypothetical protein [Vibrio cholerae]EJL6708100.1 hypothetical protein [Vibrio cholerae]ELK6274875.1 hypothetical protein [Vibrio cholerae]